MIKVQFVCDYCGGTSASIEEDFTTVFCKGCNQPEVLDRPLTLHPHIPKIKQRAFIAIDPNGNRHEGVGVSYFAKKHNLDASRISVCLKDPEKYYKGWIFIDKGIRLYHTLKERDEAYRA